MKNRIIEKIENALQTLKNGGLIIITDDENRESEGDMGGLAEYVTQKQLIRWLPMLEDCCAYR